MVAREETSQSQYRRSRLLELPFRGQQDSKDDVPQTPRRRRSCELRPAPSASCQHCARPARRSKLAPRRARMRARGSVPSRNLFVLGLVLVSKPRITRGGSSRATRQEWPSPKSRLLGWHSGPGGPVGRAQAPSSPPVYCPGFTL